MIHTVAFAGSAAAIPPPPDRTALDCSAPVYASDHLVCADPELRALAADVAQKSAQIVPAELTGDSLFEPNETWLRRRSRCAFEADHRGCLKAAYRDRANVLAGFASKAGQSSKLACSGIWAKRDLRRSAGDMRAMRVTEGDRLLAVGTQAVPGSAWKPAVMARTRGSTVVFKPLGAPAIRCVSTP